jgi:hypothetical protein
MDDKGAHPPHRALTVFVSYRREDTSGHAGRLYDALVSRFGSQNVFIDVDTIAPGTDYTKAIERAVTSCDVFIALIGPGWLTVTDADGRRRLEQPNDAVRLELESALSRDLVVIPICVHGGAIPPADALPSSLAPLALRQAIELRDSVWHEDVQRLIRRLERIATDKFPSTDVGSASTPTPGARERAPGVESDRSSLPARCSQLAPWGSQWLSSRSTKAALVGAAPRTRGLGGATQARRGRAPRARRRSPPQARRRRQRRSS